MKRIENIEYEMKIKDEINRKNDKFDKKYNVQKKIDYIYDCSHPSNTDGSSIMTH